MSNVRIACIQLDIAPGQVAENLAAIERRIAAAAGEVEHLVALPEAATTDYYVEGFAPLAAPVPGPQCDVLMRAARQNNVMVTAGLIERVPEGLYNTAVLIGADGGLIGRYRKTHLSVTDRGGTIAKECDVFLPGDDLPVFETPLGVMGVMICKDGDYPEVPRVLAAKGAETILWLTNRGGVNITAAGLYAGSNHSAVVVANRAKGHVNGGGSAILDWRGRILAGEDRSRDEAVLLADVDMDALREARHTWWSETRIRRPELYGALADRP